MTTVTQLLDHLIKAAGDMGKLKDPIPSTLIKARARIQHLEGQLAAAETMRDRFALQLLPGIMADFRAITTSIGTKLTTEDAISLAYHHADKVLAYRVEGSAGAPGETTSPKNSAPVYHVGDRLKLHGKTATITDAELDDEGVWRYDWSFRSGGGEGSFSAAEIAEIRAGEKQ